jgi:hypothetical protein
MHLVGYLYEDIALCLSVVVYKTSDGTESLQLTAWCAFSSYNNNNNNNNNNRIPGTTDGTSLSTL